MTFDPGGNELRIARLLNKGVNVWGPERVYVAPDVPLDNIEEGASLHHCSVSGESTRIGRGSEIGRSGHALIEDTQIGRDCKLGAGLYKGATLLDRAAVRGFAELRPGTLLEEDTEAAHSTGFKNTILTATCVTGSLINYCDLMMSGGTSRKDHSEVGSGVIHFNFDPRGDKWGSLLGDVTGVLLRSAPVFVGGQCGLVGPVHVDFGAVVAAGSIVRKNVGRDRIRFESAETSETEGFDREIYTGLRRKFLMTARLIGNLRALDVWYQTVRARGAADELLPLYEAARKQALAHAAERTKRILKILGKLEKSIAKVETLNDEGLSRCAADHRHMLERAEQIEAALTAEPDHDGPPAAFAVAYDDARADAEYVDAVRAVDDDAASAATDWLANMASQTEQRLAELLPG